MRFYETYGQFAEKSALLNALGSKAVRKVVLALLNEETPRSVNWITSITGLKQSTASRAVSKLRRVGLVRYYPAGRERLVKINPDGLQKISALMNQITNLIAGKIDYESGNN